MKERELRKRVKKGGTVKKHLDLDGEDTSDELYCGFRHRPDYLVSQKSPPKSVTKKDSTKKDLKKPRESKFQKKVTITISPNLHLEN
jgi:hypothetical protein